MVLDGVVSAAFKVFGDIGPSVFKLAVLEEENPLLLVRPVDLLDFRVQVVVPSLTALLSLTARQFGGDSGPTLGTMLEHHLKHLLVFLLGPGTLD